MKVYEFQYVDDDSAQLKKFVCEADSYEDATQQMYGSIPELYYYEIVGGIEHDE